MEKRGFSSQHGRMHGYVIVLLALSLLMLLGIVLVSLFDVGISASNKLALFILIGVPALIILALVLAMIYVARMPTVHVEVHPAREYPRLWLIGGCGLLLLGLTNCAAYFTETKHLFMQLPGAIINMVVGLGLLSSGIAVLCRRRREGK